ncbi:hypothetical protein SLEP1_g52498 [Rubroshorea leprosula]|uniref:Uncharacterized protein n=1 Tax=Rubroshorea leprosula TaxID=152421 RepID=A0AAV5M798_9ROSI|nr:hypothetical protein SLEP1_g52498 [Rubroshorea leprosula]
MVFLLWPPVSSFLSLVLLSFFIFLILNKLYKLLVNAFVDHLLPSNVQVPVTSETTGNKRSRRKKTLPELKEEESSLLKEKRYLKNELATFRLKVEKERAENEILKRMKLDLLSNRATEATMALVVPNSTISDQCQQTQVCNGPKSVACNADEPTLPNNSAKLQEVGNREPSFLLPDLNVPFEDDLGSGVLHGLS